MISNEFINYNNKLFILYRKVKQNHLKENYINDVKDMWHCDLVLKTKNESEVYLLFVREIPDAVIVRDVI
jgi:hypothetical protein